MGARRTARCSTCPTVELQPRLASIFGTQRPYVCRRQIWGNSQAQKGGYRTFPPDWKVLPPVGYRPEAKGRVVDTACAVIAPGQAKAPTTPTDINTFHCAYESFNGWGGRGCRTFVPVLGGEPTKIPPPGDMLDQYPGQMNSIRCKLADHVRGHVVLSPEKVVLMTSPGTESSYVRPPQSLNDSYGHTHEVLLKKTAEQQKVNLSGELHE